MAAAGPRDGGGEGGAAVPSRKQCLIRRNHEREQHGVAVSCLRELRSKGALRAGLGAKSGGRGGTLRVGGGCIGGRSQGWGRGRDPLRGRGEV